jgi:hypothetical protein
MGGRVTPSAWAQPNGMSGEPGIRWSEEEAFLPYDMENLSAWQENSEIKPIMPGEMIDWRVSEAGANARTLDECQGPLPILANAQALGYTTPGELAALDKRPRRITWFSLGETYVEDFDVDGRRIIPPYPIHPAGIMVPQQASMSVHGETPPPITSELSFTGGTESQFLAQLEAIGQ